MEFEGEHEPDMIRHCGWFGSSGDSQLCCRRRVEDAGIGASSPEPRAEARAAQYESGLIGLVAVRTRSHKEYTSDPTERKDADTTHHVCTVVMASGLSPEGVAGVAVH